MVGLWLLVWFGANQPIVHGWWLACLIVVAILDVL